MNQIEVWHGRRVVVATQNDAGRPWSARLYVNATKADPATSLDATATLTARSFKTEQGARKWAAKVLEA